MSWEQDGFHTVTFDVDLRPTFECSAPDDAECNCGCAEECDAYTNGDGCGHRRTIPLGWCNVVTWLENSEESYRGGMVSLPIEYEWTGDFYAWRFAR